MQAAIRMPAGVSVPAAAIGEGGVENVGEDRFHWSRLAAQVLRRREGYAMALLL
jgi:hypothetical protein